MGRRSQHPEEFRREAVRLALTTDKSMAEVGRDLDINYKTLGNWVRIEEARQAQDGELGALSENERLELKRLRKRPTPVSLFHRRWDATDRGERQVHLHCAVHLQSLGMSPKAQRTG